MNRPSQASSMPVDLPYICRHLWKNIFVILMSACIVGIAAFVGLDMYMGSSYTASMNLSVIARDNSGTRLNDGSLNTAITRNLNVLNSDMLAEQICKDSQIERLPGTISASQVADTNMITLNATASSAEEALRLLKSALESYPTLTGYFESGYMFRNLTALSADNIQKQDARPLYYAALAALLVLAGGVGLTVFLCMSTDKVYNRQQAAMVLDIPVLNTIHYFRKKKKDPTYKTIYNSKKEMKAAVKAFRKSVMKKGDKKKAESIHYSMEPQLSYSLIDQKTGQVKVLVGGRGQKQDDLALNRATSVKRQPGSTFKILSTYAPAIDTGSMTLATVFDDAPYQYENGQKVTNYVSTSYKGLTTVRDAIIDSNNIVAVKALTDLTPQVGFDFLQKLGFTTLVNNRVSTNGTYESDVNQSLALGGITDGVTNVELTAAYAAIANQGTYNTPVLYTTVKDSNGNVLLLSLIHI